MNGPLTFIAGPFSGDYGNVRRAIEVHTALMDAGIPSICPHLTMFADLIAPRDYEQWLALSLAQVERCEWVYRIEGVSPGADREVAHADELGVRVWTETVRAGTALDRFIDFVLTEQRRMSLCQHCFEDPCSCRLEAAADVNELSVGVAARGSATPQERHQSDPASRVTTVASVPGDAGRQPGIREPGELVQGDALNGADDLNPVARERCTCPHSIECPQWGARQPDPWARL